MDTIEIRLDEYILNALIGFSVAIQRSITNNKPPISSLDERQVNMQLLEYLKPINSQIDQ